MQRPRPNLVTSAGEIGQLQFNEKSFSQRNLQVGGVYTILGAAGSAVRVGQFATLMIANTANAAAYVKFGDSAVAAPTGIADGIYLPPNSVSYLSAGDATHIRASAATVGVYKMVDNITIATEPDK